MSTPTPALLVPPVRLGRLLGEARLTSGESLEDLARRCGLVYEVEFFAEVEAGRAPLDEPLVRWLADVYGVQAGALVPARSQLIIDLTEGQVAVGGAAVSFAAPDPQQILTNYLALVYSLRGLPVGTPIPLRQADLVVLGDALQQSPREVSSSLGRMMIGGTDQVRDHARGLRRRLVVPVAGILVGLTAVGGLLLVRSDGAGSAGANGSPSGPAVSAIASVPAPQIGDAVVLERGTSGGPSVQQIRHG